MSHKEVQYDDQGVPHKVDVPDADEPSPAPAPKPAPPKPAPPKPSPPPKPLPGGDQNACGTAQQCADKMSSNQSTDHMNGYG